MDNLAALRSLASAARQGSLSAAARHLRITQPAVSQHIAALERAYGVELVIRGRNGIQMTEAGDLVLCHAEDVLAGLARLDEAMSALKSSPDGRLAIACPLLIARSVIVPVLADLRRLHPNLRIDLKESDQIQAPAELGVDLAIRACRLGPAEGTVRKLADIEQVLVAAPTYLDRVGRPQSAASVATLDYIQYKDDPDERSLPLADGSEMPVTVAFAAQMPDLMLHAVRSNLGIASLPRFFVQLLLDTGEIEEVLPTHPIAAKALYLMRAPGTSSKSRRVAIFVERFVAELGTLRGFRLATGSPRHQPQ